MIKNFSIMLEEESKRLPLIVANWKMHGLADTGRELATQIALNKAGESNIVLCPPFTALYQVGHAIGGTAIKLGAQDCHWEEKGAYTGDISASMLKNTGCSYVIVGHSERRKHYLESDEIVAQKAATAHKNGLISIICVGETEECRAEGYTLETIEEQIQNSIPESADSENTIIAYEPIWAIGTGNAATLEQIEEVHVAINKFVAKNENFTEPADPLYGGSVTPENAYNIVKTEGVGGVLVGSASIDAEKFRDIVALIKV